MEAAIRRRGRKLNGRTVAAALLVRALFVLHNVLAVWRVAVSREDGVYWVLVTGNLLIILEAVLVIRFNDGLEWKWWCPCFMAYLLTTLPAIWLLQLAQHEHAKSGTGNDITCKQPVDMATQNSTGNETDYYSTTPLTTTESTSLGKSLQSLLTVSESNWIVLIQEMLVYIIVFGRWMLPRNQVSREALSDLLLQYLAMASDSMELFAIFDEKKVQENLQLTYAILSIWSLSFIQFIPVLVHKHKYQHMQGKRMRKINRACGRYFSEVVITVLSILFQDGPFMCLRLFIMIQYKLVTYSLVFFVLKNIVTIMILLYRLTILCVRLPGCYHETAVIVGCESVDLSSPVTLPPPLSPSSELVDELHDSDVVNTKHGGELRSHVGYLPQIEPVRDRRLGQSANMSVDGVDKDDSEETGRDSENDKRIDVVGAEGAGVHDSDRDGDSFGIVPDLSGGKSEERADDSSYTVTAVIESHSL